MARPRKRIARIDLPHGSGSTCAAPPVVWRRCPKDEHATLVRSDGEVKNKPREARDNPLVSQSKSAATRRRDRRRVLQVGIAGLLRSRGCSRGIRRLLAAARAIERARLRPLPEHQAARERGKSRRADRRRRHRRGVDPRARAMALAALRDRERSSIGCASLALRRSPSTWSSPSLTAPRSRTRRRR